MKKQLDGSILVSACLLLGGVVIGALGLVYRKGRADEVRYICQSVEDEGETTLTYQSDELKDTKIKMIQL